MKLDLIHLFIKVHLLSMKENKFVITVKHMTATRFSIFQIKNGFDGCYLGMCI